MIKKKSFLLIVLITLLFLMGCEDKNTATAVKKSTLTVVTSFYPIYISTLNIAGNIPGVKIVNLAPVQTGCLHDYQLNPEDIRTLSQADIFIINGAGSESFIDKAVTQNPHLKIVEASKGIPLIKEKGIPNPHVWVSISGNIQEVNNISRQLAALDPIHSDQYLQNGARYAAKLTALRAQMHAAIDPLPNRKIVTFHEAFPYFAREFGLTVIAVVEREPGSEPSAGELAKTVQLVKKSDVHAIFVEPQYPPGSAQVIARETTVGVYSLDPAVTGKVTPNAYLNAMRQNMKVLEKALK